MKWIGQHIYDLVSRFRNDVYLEDISTGTIASGAHLGLDSNNKIVKAVDGGGDLTSIVAGTGLSGTSLTGPIPTLNVDATQAGITGLGTITSGTWQSTTAEIESAYLDPDTAHLTTAQTFTGSKTMGTDVKLNFRDANSTISSPTANDLEIAATDITLDAAGGIFMEASDLTMYDPVNGGNPSFSIGANSNDRFVTTAIYNSGAQTLDSVAFQTLTTSASTNDGRYVWYVDEVELARLLDDGLLVYGYVNSIGDGAFVQTRNTTASSATEGGKLRLVCDDGAAMGDDHRLGVIEFQGAEDASGNKQTGASIQAMCDAAWSDTVNDTRLEFYTMDGNASPELSLTLDSNLLATFAGAVTVTGALTGTLATASQPNITGVGTIGTGVWRGTAITSTYIGDDQVTEDKLADTLLAEIDANTAKVTNVATNLTATTHASQITINSSDGTNVIVAEASGSIAGVMSVTHHDKLDAIEASATADQSKSDIDGLAITTVGTIDTGVWNGTAIATDQQKHLATFDIRGYSTADGTNYEIPVFVTDNNAPFEHNTSAGSDGLTALAITKLIRATGVVMPYAGTLKKWKGWSTHSTTSGTCNIALFRYRPVAGNSSAVSLVLLDAVGHTPAGNSKVIDIEQTTFTDADVAEGDIIISGIKGDGSQITHFVSTLEIEWD